MVNEKIKPIPKEYHLLIVVMGILIAIYGQLIAGALIFVVGALSYYGIIDPMEVGKYGDRGTAKKQVIEKKEPRTDSGEPDKEPIKSDLSNVWKDFKL